MPKKYCYNLLITIFDLGMTFLNCDDAEDVLLQNVVPLTFTTSPLLSLALGNIVKSLRTLDFILEND